MAEQAITDNLDELLAVLPAGIRDGLIQQGHLDDLLEIVLDLGRPPEARFPDRWAVLAENPVRHEELEHVMSRVGEFGEDNRAGIERTLHRISAIRNRSGRCVGLTCRIGRSVYGTVDIIRDIVESGASILLLGRPGIGKTTKLREVARVLADELDKRVVIVDTSNEIAGDGDVPHPGIGRARRMQVRRPELQHAVMIEAVENHMPEVIVIDEIGTEAEAMAARTIAERGVQLVGTAHGNTLDNLLMNPTLQDLVGGIHAVTLSDEEAKRRHTQKTVLERKAPPSFDVVIEIMEFDKLAIHHDVASVVDRFLRGQPATPETRVRRPDGEVEIIPPQELPFEDMIEADFYPREPPPAPIARDHELRVFPYGVSRNKLERAMRDLGLSARITRSWNDADVILMLKAHERRSPAKLQEAARAGTPVHILRSNTQQQIATALREVGRLRQYSAEERALREARQAIEQVLTDSRPVELSPQNAYLRRLQHRLASQYDLTSESVGVEPHRRVRISK
jgi:stage III sporulation protein SpoIIIAA